MSRQLKSKFSIATLTAVVSLILGTQVAGAATVGKTNVISSQNEPLSASIDVSNIDANNFTANIAGSAIYREMDMSTDVPVRVQFVKTSPSTGKLILTSSQPVTDPYADVVLVLNDGGKQQSLPKTLLLPINNVPAPSSPIITPREPVSAATNVNTNVDVAPVNTITPARMSPKRETNQYVMVGDSVKPSLPTVQAREPHQPVKSTTNAQSTNSVNNFQNNSDSNITVTRTIRPAGSTQSRNATSAQSMSSNAGVSAPSTARSNTVIDTPLINAQRNNQTNINQANNNQANRITFNSSSSLNGNATTAGMPLISSDTNVQSEILTTEISRKIKLPNGELRVLPNSANIMQAKRNSGNVSSSIPTSTNATNGATNTTGTQFSFKPLIPAPAFKPSPTGVQDNMIEDAIVKHARETPDAAVINVNTPETVPKPYDPAQTMQAQNNEMGVNTSDPAASPAQIATQANRSNIGLSKVTYTVQRNDNLWTIANQIARQNKVDVETVMSQIQEYNPDAFIDGDARMLKANAKLAIPDYEVIPSRLGIRAASSAQKSSSRAPTRARASSNTRRRAAPHPLPRANVRLVTPNNSGSATGSGNRGLSSALTNRVQQTRQQTANEARRVAGLNSQLSEYTHKLRLQNDRLSDLEMRLKELRQQ